MDLRKAMKMAPSILLLKGHVKEHQRRSKSGAVHGDQAGKDKIKKSYSEQLMDLAKREKK